MKNIIYYKLLLMFIAFCLSYPSEAVSLEQTETSKETQSKVNPRYISLDSIKLAKLKSKIISDVSTSQSYKELLGQADVWLKKGPYSVTYKQFTPPSGDMHDYMSMGPYWWPDPSKPDGLPYINRDGRVNPNTRKITDQSHFSELASAVKSLSLAYFYSNKEKYAEYAAKLIKIFFIDPTTKMNPNLRFGQAIPGRCDGRGIGLIETTGIAYIVEGVTLISESKSWNKSLDGHFKKWVDDFVTWTQTHQYGIDERNATNNHGTHYDAQVVAMLMFCGKTEQAKVHIETYTKPRLMAQLAKDGAQTDEIKRTKSFNYSVMNAKGFLKLARMAENLEIDLWNYTVNGQTYIKSMIDWFIPYLKLQKSWDYQQIINFDMTNLVPILVTATEKYDNSEYIDLISTMKSLNNRITMSTDYSFTNYNHLTND